jgi:vanillate O-demethylase ferredoxin subunit
MNPPASYRVRVRSIEWLAEGVHGITLESLDGQPLPRAEPGSHVDVVLRAPLSRSYSVVGDGGLPGRYEIAVARDARSRGGSRYVHETLRAGDQLDIGAPRNLFALVEDAGHSLLVAGGIGITPIWSMVKRLEQLGRPWTLFYATRGRRHAAFLPAIEALAQETSRGRVLLHFDDEQGGAAPDLAPVLDAAADDAHLYCCGPQPMLAAFERLTAARPASQVHVERFAPAQTRADGDRAFVLNLARSGMALDVPPDKSILDVLLENNIDAQYGCMQGACGMCEAAVLDGTPEHRDTLLSDTAKSSNRTMLICCSRSRTPTLTLDL